MSAPRRVRRAWWVLAIAFPLLTLIAAVGGVLIAGQGGFQALSVPHHGELKPATDAATLARGEYLARLGNCTTCHTRRGGAPLAGGRAFVTEWGTLYSTNLTPDADTGIGAWSLDEFRHVMAHGVSRNGPLYPAFPMQHFQHLDSADVDAIFAWLMSRPTIASDVPANRLEGIAGWRSAMLGWRMLFHRPQSLPDADAMGASWQRGRYLVEGLGHCAMCHGERGPWGSQEPLLRHAGSRIPGQGWLAPTLDRDTLSRWTVSDLARYLRTGTAPQASAYGPMAEVIQSSLQHLTEADALAMAEYLLDLRPAPRLARRAAPPAERARNLVGSHSLALYETHCADCHGGDGRGREGVFPPLAGNPQVTAADPVNLIRVTLFGAAAPTTAANPAPHSMPPFADRLPEADLIALLNHVRGSWGNDATAITPPQLQAIRTLPLE
ncbi:c-type cytochrome [Xanthomonadaceae bacterium JHOS43]|nr:c-type cytochrome [Xanthomonadaceae bacterium JHOS43]